MSLLAPATRRAVLESRCRGSRCCCGGQVWLKPNEVINNVKDKIKEMNQDYHKKTLPDGSISKSNVRSLWQDRLDKGWQSGNTRISTFPRNSHKHYCNYYTGNESQGINIVAGLLPIGVLMTFILMKFFGVEANIVALSGIAIAIGVMVDIGMLMWRIFSGILKCLSIMDCVVKSWWM